MVIKIVFDADTPIYTQIYNQIVIGIASGALQKGEELPSVRRLSADIGVNLHTVNKAYAMLRDESFIVMDRRSGASISAKDPEMGNIMQQLEQELTPMVAQAICKGVTREQFNELCSRLYSSILS